MFVTVAALAWIDIFPLFSVYLAHYCCVLDTVLCPVSGLCRSLQWPRDWAGMAVLHLLLCPPASALRLSSTRQADCQQVSLSIESPRLLDYSPSLGPVRSRDSWPLRTVSAEGSFTHGPSLCCSHSACRNLSYAKLAPALGASPPFTSGYAQYHFHLPSGSTWMPPFDLRLL